MFYRIYKNLEDIPVKPFGTPKIGAGSNRTHMDSTGLMHYKDGDIQRYLFASIMESFGWKDGYGQWMDLINFEKLKQEIFSIPIEDLIDSYFVTESTYPEIHFTVFHISSS